MKYVKILGLLAIAAAALMAFAGTASATLTDGSGNLVTKIAATSTGTTLTGSTSVACTHSLIEAAITSNGANHAEGAATKLTFNGCGNHTVNVTSQGMGSTLTITDANNGNGTVFSSGLEITILTHSIFLGTRHCTYATDDTHLGTVTSGTRAKLTIVSEPIPLVFNPATENDKLCSADMQWDGSYEFIDPHVLAID